MIVFNKEGAQLLNATGAMQRHIMQEEKRAINHNTHRHAHSRNYNDYSGSQGVGSQGVYASSPESGYIIKQCCRTSKAVGKVVPRAVVRRRMWKSKITSNEKKQNTTSRRCNVNMRRRILKCRLEARNERKEDEHVLMAAGKVVPRAARKGKRSVVRWAVLMGVSLAVDWV